MPDDRHLRSFTIGSVAAQLEDTLVGGYRRLAAEAPRRRIDIELRVLDILFATRLRAAPAARSRS